MKSDGGVIDARSHPTRQLRPRDVDGKSVGAIERGFLVLVGVTHGDTRAEADWLARKIAGLRIFEDEAGKMNLGLADIGGAALVVSQFTLYGDARKGRRP